MSTEIFKPWMQKRGHVRSLEFAERAEDFLVTFNVAAGEEPDLEQWAAEQLGPLLRMVYGKGFW